MYYIHHVHPASASVQSVYLPNFLPQGPSLCVVRHSSLSFLSLYGEAGSGHEALSELFNVPINASGHEALSELFNVPINGRILKVERIAGGHDQADRIGVLTDHYQPRLFVLAYAGRPTFQLSAEDGDESSTYSKNGNSSWTDVKTEATITLEELGRPSAESGLTFEVEHGQGSRYAFVHAHVGTLKVCTIESTKSGLDLAHAFNVRTPHPHLISSTFLERATSSSANIVALLSLSSIASRLPGLGMQCLPVLSFHTIDEAKQELKPMPWGGTQAKPSTSSEQANAASAGPTSSSSKQRRRSSQAQQSMPGSFDKKDEKPASSSKFGPSASGATRTAEEEAAADEALAKSPLGMAHVPLPFTDALGAHMLLALPARVGGGVLVFCESTILLVPPPTVSSVAEARRSSVRSPKLSPGKRRKSSVTATEPESAVTDSSALSTSPTTAIGSGAPRANENGKRRRSTASSAVSTAQTSAGTERRRRSSAGLACAGRRILRLDVAPMIVAASLVVRSPGEASDDGVQEAEDGKLIVKVLFATHAGALHLLTISLDGERSELARPAAFKPVSMKVVCVGEVPAPGSQGGLTYLGENFVHVASTGGDSVVAKLTEVGIETVHRWPNLAPILDFVVDDGVGGDPTNAQSAQARVITCSGSGATGSLRTVRNGVTMHDIARLDQSDVQNTFAISNPADGVTSLLVCSYRDGSRIFKLAESGLEDVTASLDEQGYDHKQQILAAAGIDDRHFVIVTAYGVHVLAYGSSSAHDQFVNWNVAELTDKNIPVGKKGVTQAAVNESGQILLAFATGHLIYLQARATSIALLTITQLECEISALDITPLSTSTAAEKATIAAVSLWKPSVVKLIKLPDLRDVTPNALVTPQTALIRSVKLHIFADNGQPTSTPQILIGLGDGTLVSHSLSMPTEDSVSQTIGVLEHRVASLGSRPVQLRSFVTSQHLHAVIAISDRSTVIFSRGPGLVYSALGQEGVRDVSALAYRTSTGGLERIAAFVSDHAIDLVQIGEISKLYIGGTSLGHDNPLALTLCAKGKVIGVVTTSFLPEGRGDAPVQGGKVLLRDLTTLEALDAMTLEDEERPNCIDSFTFHGLSHLVVGTGYAFPDRTETTMGRVLILRVDSKTRKLDVVASHNVEGNVFDVKAISSTHLVACVNAKVISLSLEQDDIDMNAKEEVQDAIIEPSTLRLRQMDQWGCAFTVTTVSHVKPDRLVVGDALRSIAILRVDADKKLRELARDCDPYWTVACEALNEQEEVYIGSDIAFNLWTCKRLKWTQAAKTRIEQNRLRESETGGTASGVGLVDDTWSHIMQRDAGIHYGDLINKMRRGGLTVNANGGGGERDAIQSRIVFATAAGAIGLVAEVNERAGRILTQLEAKLNDAWSPVGKISADDYRTLRTDHRTQPAAGFIDGDTIRRGFESLSLNKRSTLSRRGRLPIDAGMDEINRLVESIARLS